jgi:hypothetical protein
MIDRILLSKILALIHNLIIIVPFIYFFIYLLNDTKYDIYLLAYILFIRGHWFLFKGECIFTYFEKKIAIPKYVLGSDIYNVPSNSLIGNDYIYKKVSLFSLEKFVDFYQNLFIFFVLLRNLKSKNFNLLLVLSLIAIIIQSCWNKINAEYNLKLRKKYKHKRIIKIPLSKRKIY